MYWLKHAYQKTALLRLVQRVEYEFSSVNVILVAYEIFQKLTPVIRLKQKS